MYTEYETLVRQLAEACEALSVAIAEHADDAHVSSFGAFMLLETTEALNSLVAARARAASRNDQDIQRARDAIAPIMEARLDTFEAIRRIVGAMQAAAAAEAVADVIRPPFRPENN